MVTIWMIRRLVLDRHEAFYRSRVAQTVRDPETQVELAFRENEKVMVEVSHKVFLHRLKL
jgi:uncharacterized SAM-dependent methyltransferase